MLADMVSWRHYENQGISHAQHRVIIANVLDGKSQDQWLDGVFDEAVLENDRIAAFERMVTVSRYSPDSHHFEEMDGEHHPWDRLSAAAKLTYIARDAAHCEVRFTAFAEVAKDVIGEDLEAALQVLFEHQKERTAVAKLLPDDGRTESTPLVEQVQDMMDYVAELETQIEQRVQSMEIRSQGISNALESTQPQGRSDGAVFCLSYSWSSSGDSFDMSYFHTPQGDFPVCRVSTRFILSRYLIGHDACQDCSA